MANGNKYTGMNICAVIVTYNPDMVLLKNLAALLPQVGRCLIVDNGSSQREVLDTIIADQKITLIQMGENKGIASALNRGARQCNEEGYSLLLTMDQDTVLAKNAIEELLKVMNNQEVCSVGINWDGRAVKDELVSYLITSGNLVTIKAVKAVGGYDEKLFIDSVDFDFSLRLKDNGYKMVKVANAKAIHQLGEKQDGRNYITHSVERYYYIYRNHFYLINKYWNTHRTFCIKKQIALMIDLLRIILFDRKRAAKIKMLKKGYKDSKKLADETV